MTKNYKDFLDWATPQLTLNQYRKLAKIIYSFKKYSLINDQATSELCRFKDTSVYAYTHFQQFFAEMGKLAGGYPKQFFETWYNDNVIFWPYKESPDLVEARKRLMTKCENHSTHYRFLYIFRENKYGEITLLKIVNKSFSGSPLWDHSLEEYIDGLWNAYNGYKQDDAKDYAREHNTKKILKHCLGFSNEQYKELVGKYPRKPNLNLSSYQASVYSYFVKVYNQLIDIPIDTLYLPYLYYKYVSDEHGINPEGSTFISDIIIGIAELKERGELK